MNKPGVPIDPQTRIVPASRVSKADSYSAGCFVEDLASRLNGDRVQISTDALAAHAEAIELGFGAEADYGPIGKTYGVYLLPGVRRCEREK